MPIAPVEITLRVGGIAGVKSAMRGVQDTLDQVARTGMRTTETAARARVKSEVSASKETERALKEQARIRNQINNLEVAEAKKAAATGVKEVEKAERDKTRLTQQYAKQREQIFQNSSRAAQRLSEQQIREEQRNVEKSRAMRTSRADAVGGAASRATRGVLGMVGRAAGIAASIGGGFALADSLQTGMSQEALAGQVVRGAQVTGGLTKTDVLDTARSSAIAVGGKTDDVLGGLNEFVKKTGRLDEANKLLERMAKLSAATGASISDMGSTAAEVFNQLGDTDKTFDVLRAFAGQGKAGAIDIRDLGQYGARLAASAAQYTGDLGGNIESFGAIAQLAKSKGGATDTAEATEAVARISSDVTKHQDKFRAIGGGGKNGVEVFADKAHTKLRNAEDIITETVSKTHGDLGQLHELFGERSIKAALGAQVVYSNAGGGKAGTEAIREQFRGLHTTTMSMGDIDQGVEDVLAENQSKLNKATEEFQKALNEKLLPVMPKLIDQFVQLIPSISKGAEAFATLVPLIVSVVGAMAEWPRTSLAAIVALNAFGPALAGVIAKVGVTALTGGSAGEVATTAVGGGGNAALLGAAGLPAVVAGTLLGGLAVNRGILDSGSDTAKEHQKTGRALNDLVNTAGSVAEGSSTPEGRTKAEENLQQVRTLISAGKAYESEGTLGNLGKAVKQVATGDVVGQKATLQAQQAATSLDKLQKAADVLTAALQATANTVGAADLGRADPNDPSRAPVQVGR